nr:immunoglobulin light chain junction region [Macaca mulatta]
CQQHSRWPQLTF